MPRNRFQPPLARGRLGVGDARERPGGDDVRQHEHRGERTGPGGREHQHAARRATCAIANRTVRARADHRGDRGDAALAVGHDVLHGAERVARDAPEEERGEQRDQLRRERRTREHEPVDRRAHEVRARGDRVEERDLLEAQPRHRVRDDREQADREHQPATPADRAATSITTNGTHERDGGDDRGAVHGSARAAHPRRRPCAGSRRRTRSRTRR